MFKKLCPKVSVLAKVSAIWGIGSIGIGISEYPSIGIGISEYPSIGIGENFGIGAALPFTQKW